MRSTLQFACLLALSAGLPAGVLVAQESPEQAWGNLSGAFVFDGAPPLRPLLEVSPDVEFCGAIVPRDESLVVGALGGVKNIVVFLRLEAGEATPPVHPDYAASAQADVRLTAGGCQLEPHVVALRSSQTLVLDNDDAVAHGVRLDLRSNAPSSSVVPRRDVKRHQFTSAERLPCPVGCSIHPWMRAWLLVQDHPYMAVTDEYGRFAIENLPVGEWTFQFWHEKAGYLQQVTRDGELNEWPKGRLTVTIAPGANDLDVLRLSPRIFD